MSHHETVPPLILGFLKSWNCTSSDLSLFSYHETVRCTSSDFALSLCYQSQWRGLITAQWVCKGSSTVRGTLRGTVHLRSMTWHISCHGDVWDLALFKEHLRSMTWHISCHGDIRDLALFGAPACWHCSSEVYDLAHILSWLCMGSSTVRGTSLLALFIWGLWLGTYLVMVMCGI